MEPFITAVIIGYAVRITSNLFFLPSSPVGATTAALQSLLDGWSIRILSVLRSAFSAEGCLPTLPLTVLRFPSFLSLRL